MTKDQNFTKEVFILISIGNECQEHENRTTAEQALSLQKEKEFALVRVWSDGGSINTELLNNPNFSIDGGKDSARTFIEQNFGNQLRNTAEKMRENFKLASEKKDCA